jgi:hypothetical protein
MSTLQEDDHFESLCQKHEIWPIGYQSPHWPTPLLLIWYTDRLESQLDRLLTDSAGNILASKSWANLISSLRDLAPLTHAEPFTSWLSGIEEVPLSVQTSYDMITLTNLLGDGKLTMPMLETVTHWRNMFGNFLYQDPQNSYLEPYYEDPLLNQVWEYYYEVGFWPRYAKAGQSVRWRRPPLLIDKPLLLERLSAMINAFDARIRLVEAVILPSN